MKKHTLAALGLSLCLLLSACGATAAAGDGEPLLAGQVVEQGGRHYSNTVLFSMRPRPSISTATTSPSPM